MSTTIRLKSSGSTGNIPSNSELAFGEVALNYADGILYFKNSNDVVTQISGSGANTFETINANGTLLIPDSNVDILTLSSGNGIHIAGNASSDSLTVSVRFDDTVISTSTDTAATANAVKTAYDYADSAHLEATSAVAEALDASALANSAYNQANNAYAKANAPITIKEVYASNNSVVNTFANISTIQFDADSGMAVVDEGNNAVTIQLNSTFKTWNINGGPGLVAFGLDTVNFLSANGITLSANNLSSPKTFKIDATELPNAYAQANAAYGAANNRVLKSGDTMTGQLNISSGGLLVTGNTNVTGNISATNDVIASGILKSTQSAGDEGGEISLNIPQTNTSIAGAVAIDIYQNKLRIFETSGNNRGVYIDFTATPAGVSRDLLAGGPQGSQGYQGVQGATGPQGFQGETGPQGPQGVQGVQGHQGFQGATGPQGPQGVQGSVGAQGHQGVQGEIGAQGVQGSQGVQGATGPQGSQGAQGEIGAQGYQGFQGETGPQGPQGVQGVQGHQGFQGATGPQGFQGVLGAQGHQGVQGSQGVQGETGSFGGATFEYVFNTNTANTDPTSGFVKFNNTTLLSATQMYIDYEDRLAANVFNYLNTIDDSTSTIKGTFKIANTANVLEYAFFNIDGSHLHVTDWFVVPVAGLNSTLTGSNFPDSTNVTMTFVRTGDKGDTGAQGPQGIQGATGPQGFQGVDGAQGAIGAQGVQGHQGFQGATGPQGSQGLTGAQGSVGAQGAQGDVGPQGAQGTAGAQGAAGPQGAQGAQGAPGVSANGTANTVAKFTSATTIADSQIFDNGTNIGFGTTSPNVKVDIIGALAGSLRLSHDTTNAANKLGRIVGRPYTNADTDFLAFDIRGLSALNEINYGGGSNILNAVQRHRFYTATNATTIAGTEQMRIEDNGNVLIGVTSSTNKLEVNGSIGVTNTTGTVIFTQYGNVFTTSAVTSYTVDTFAAASFRSAKYFAQMAATTGPTYGAIELNLVHDGTTVYLTQYGENKSNASANLGLFDASITSGALNLTFTPGSVYAAQTVKVVRLAVTD